jgi:hypothetical protein
MNHDDKYNFTQINDHKTFTSIMNKYLTDKQERNLILGPISGELRAKMQKSGNLDVSMPQVLGDLTFNDVR